MNSFVDDLVVTCDGTEDTLNSVVINTSDGTNYLLIAALLSYRLSLLNII